MKYIKRLTENMFVLSLIKKANTIIFGFLTTVLIHHLLSPEMKGQYEYINNIIVTLTTILNMGITLVLPNYVRKNKKWTLSTFYILALFQFVINIFLSLLAWVIFRDNVYFLYGMAVACGVFSLQSLNSTLIYNFKITVFANILGVFTNAVILAVAFFVKFQNFNIVFVALIVKELLCSIICYYAMAKSIHLSEVKYSEWVGIIIAGIVPMLTSLLSILNYKVDVMELKWLGVTDYNIGIYSVGLSLSEYVLLMSDVFKDVLFNKTASADNIAIINKSLRACSSIMIIAYICIICFGKIIIKLVYGNSYIESYGVSIIVIFGTFSMMYFKLLGTLFLAQGKWNFYFLTLLGSVVLNITSNFLLIPLIGIYGAALTSLLSYSFAGIVFILKYCKTYKLKIQDVLFIRTDDLKSIYKLLRNGNSIGNSKL